VFVQDEFSGFTDDDVRRVSKRSSAVGVLRRNLLRRSQPAASGRPVNTQHVRKRRTVDAKPVSPPSSPGIVTPSPLTSPQSDSSPTRGSLKGNIKVRLLLGRYKLFPTPKERQRSKTSLVKAERKDAAGIIKKKEKRRRLNSHQSDDSAVSSSGESEVKYSLSVETAAAVPRRGRPPLQSTALIRARDRARRLVSKARGDLQVDKKTTARTAPRPWAPFWHGRLQLPTQSSRSSRKITINRRLLDDSYTSIGQLSLPQQTPIEQTNIRSATHDHRSSIKHTKAEVNKATQDHRSSIKQIKAEVSASAGCHVRGVGLLNRPLGFRPALKEQRRVHASDKTVVPSPCVTQAKSLSESAGAVGTKDVAVRAADDESKSADRRTAAAEVVGDMLETEPRWLKYADKSIFSVQTKRGTMLGKRCSICDNAYMVLHHYMCRVPCCRACARFYKTHCERDTQLDQLSCLEQGKSANYNIVIIFCTPPK